MGGSNSVRMRIVIRGVVQGVGFRPTVHRIATSLGLNGSVLNNGSGVVVEIDGDAHAFVEQLKANLPPLARIDSLEIEVTTHQVQHKGFKILPSQMGVKGVSIPNDVAVCEPCRKEMFDPSDRRHLYPFTNCTDCGARFSIIEDLPYDREKTSMRAFPMCDDCRKEYEDQQDRRFHHQTISCPRCGPKYYLMDRNGARLREDPIPTFAARLHDGAIGVSKGWGGMHICCTLPTLRRFREWYRRKEKPFAVMVRDMEAVERYSNPNEFERKLLLSSQRPIVLVPKRQNDITELISPGLGNIGIFLPYTEMQQILFSNLQEDALIMTSANVPGDPMVMKDDDALDLRADCYLMHEREIVNRCDDSVVRAFQGHTFYIRRSRGSVPSFVQYQSKGSALGMGGQEHIAGAAAKDGRIYQTQYIGDATSYGVLQFLEQALRYQMRLLDLSDVQVVGVDLHPGYTTRRLGKRLAEEMGAEVVEVQHHWAHAASLMLESGLDEIVALTLDGTGYGADGTAWGGEVLYSTFDSYHRVGHLQELPLLGGERAIQDVRRLVFAMAESGGWRYNGIDEDEALLLKKLLPASPRSSSFGRVLDAVSCYLDVCDFRSYDGEPAMKLERLLESGTDTVPIELEREGNVIRSVDMFRQLVESKGNPQDRAHSYVRSLVQGLVDVAVEEAQKHGIAHIGISGGVSYNATISAMAKSMIERSGLKFVCHDILPNGDGGVAAGQCAIALNKLHR
jgi:hydrogenase maturation protein HypF